MTRRLSAPLAGATFIGLTALLAACGTGGGGSTIPGGGGGGPTPTPTPTATPVGTPTPPPPPNITGGVTIPGVNMANALVAFTCGCSQQAGQTTADGSGNYTVTPVSTALPASPNPTYTTVPGRNYMLIGYAPSPNRTQTWTMSYLGASAAHNLSISNAGSSDVYSTAAALYIYANSQNNSDKSYDNWNFNTIMAWTALMRSGTVNPQEAQLISDIQSQQAAGNDLYPTVPVWNPVQGDTLNPTISNDVHNVASSVDAAKPTPCPSTGCTGTPTP